jgi:hypothetical protein
MGNSVFGRNSVALQSRVADLVVVMGEYAVSKG